MKENVFCVVFSIITVGIGLIIMLIEMSILMHYGETRIDALADSVYTGFLGWITLTAVLATTDWFYDHVASKIVKK